MHEAMFNELKNDEIKRLEREFSFSPDLAAKVMLRFQEVVDDIRDQSLLCVSEGKKERIIRRRLQTLIRQSTHKAIEDLRTIANAERLEIERESQQQSLRKCLLLLTIYKQYLDALKIEIDHKLFDTNGWSLYKARLQTRSEPPYEYHFRGADVYICEGPVKDYRGGKTVCVTQHSKMLTILLYRLRDLDPGVINYMNKYEFYGRVAEAIIKLNNEIAEPSLHETLSTAMTMAEQVIKEWVEGTSDQLESV